ARSTRRPRPLDASGAGAGAPLLPRSGLPLGDDARLRRRPAGDGLGGCAPPPARRDAPSRPGAGARVDQAGTAPRPRLARLPRLPRLAGPLDAARLRHVADLDASDRSRPALPPARLDPHRRDPAQAELL